MQIAIAEDIIKFGLSDVLGTDGAGVGVGIGVGLVLFFQPNEIGESPVTSNSIPFAVNVTSGYSISSAILSNQLLVNLCVSTNVYVLSFLSGYGSTTWIFHLLTNVIHFYKSRIMKEMLAITT